MRSCLALGDEEGDEIGAATLETLKVTFTWKSAASWGKSMLPRPVTGSQPTAALKPDAQHTVEPAQQLLNPDVTSLKDWFRPCDCFCAAAYSVGLTNPTEVMLFLARAALINDTSRNDTIAKRRRRRTRRRRRIRRTTRKMSVCMAMVRGLRVRVDEEEEKETVMASHPWLRTQATRRWCRRDTEWS